MIKYWKEDINIELLGNVEKEDALKIAEQYRTELQKVYPAADIVINAVSYTHLFVSSVFEEPSAYKSVRDKISEAKKKAAKQDNAKNHNHKSIDKER